MTCTYLRCRFCGRAAPLLEGTEDGKRIMWIEYREDQVITSATICRRCLLFTATEGESDRQTQQTIAQIEQAGGIIGSITAAYNRHFPEPTT